MTGEMALVLGALALALVMLATTRIPADAVLVGALVLVAACPVPTGEGWRLGVLPIEDAVAGFGNPGMLAVGALFIVVAGLRETGAIDWIAFHLLGRPRTQRGAMLRVMLPVGGLSAFLNNTPVVAMMIPAVQDWCKRLGISPSRLLIPLSYAAVLGGTCSLIGTSANLVVAGLVNTDTDLPPLGMFDVTWIGLPTALVCGAVLIWIGPRLLPDRPGANTALADTTQYTLGLIVPPGSALAGKTVDEAGLRSLPGCFLIELEREGEITAPVTPEQTLREGDLLLFAGVVESIRDLVQTRGLQVATDQVFKLDSPRYRRRLFEVVVAPSSSLIGATIRKGSFRNRFHGAVIAVARNGQRVLGRVGDVRLQAGDLLLVEADPAFDTRARGSRDFLLVRSLEDSAPRRHRRAPLAVLILVAMVTLATLGIYPMLTAAMLGAAAMVTTRCCSLREARSSIDWPVLTVIAASLGLGAALERSGTAAWLAGGILEACGDHPWALLAAIYAATSVLTCTISNNASVALMFSIAHATSVSTGIDFMPLVMAVIMGGSASFATPIAYQTNLMVYGPGAYTFGDFLRVGLLLNLVAGICTVSLTPLVFPFTP